MYQTSGIACIQRRKGQVHEMELARRGSTGFGEEFVGSLWLSCHQLSYRTLTVGHTPCSGGIKCKSLKAQNNTSLLACS